MEKFIGDAVMAVFGVPMLHEDDALRAVRSAMEMREALPELGLQGRIGVMTGEVVTGTEERLATGDAVNIVARLEQAAQPSEILIGQEIVSGAVETQAVEPLEVKGKAQPLVAYRLVTVTGETPRRHTGPMVGRKRELRLLAGAWDRAASWALLPAVHDPGCSRSRQVASRCRVPRADCRRHGCPRPLSALRRRHHLLASRGRGTSNQACASPSPAGALRAACLRPRFRLDHCGCPNPPRSRL